MLKIKSTYNWFTSLKYSEYIILSAILVVGLIVRLYKINSPIADWHSWRQADTASVAREYVSGGINFLYPKYHDISTIQTGLFNPEGYRFVEFPILNSINAWLVTSVGVFSLEVWGRLLSIVFSLISAYILFLIGRRFIGVWGGVLASFYFAFIPYNIYFSRVILPEPITVTLGLISLWLFIKFIDKADCKYLYSSGLFLSLAILTKPFVIFYSIPMLYLLWQKYGGLSKIVKNSSLLIPLLLFVDIVLIPFLLWRAWMNKFPEGIPFWKWAFNGDRIRFKPSFWRWIFGERIGSLILGAWGLIPLSFGLVSKYKSTYFNHFFFIGALVYVTILASANVMHDYYQTIIIPAIVLVLSQGTIHMWNSKLYDSRIIRSLLILSLTVMFFTGAVKVREFYKINHPEIIKAGVIADSIIPNNALVIAPYNGDTAFLYQTNRRGWPFVDRSIDKLIEVGADYYVSVNYDDTTREVMNKYDVVRQTDDFVIVRLSTSEE